MAEEREAEYHSNDFQWRDLQKEIEADPSLHYHISPFSTPASSSTSPSPADADAWRSFHRRHSAGKFFKERRYLLKEFPELGLGDVPIRVLEVGCGNGSTVLPILRAKQNATVYACDCSAEVLQTANKMIAAANNDSGGQRFQPFLLDFSVNPFPDWLFCTNCEKTPLSKPSDYYSDANLENTMSVPSFLKGSQCCIGGVDFVTLVFTLSAVPFQKMPFVIKDCFSVLRPGGLVLFRDYGLYDMTMLRFPQEQRVGFREYMRLDGTLSYFFSLDILRDLFLSAGFIELELDYCCVISVNRRNGKKMHRVWVHGKFQKPVT